jgi:hypothetical protein
MTKRRLQIWHLDAWFTNSIKTATGASLGMTWLPQGTLKYPKSAPSVFQEPLRNFKAAKQKTNVFIIFISAQKVESDPQRSPRTPLKSLGSLRALQAQSLRASKPPVASAGLAKREQLVE